MAGQAKYTIVGRYMDGQAVTYYHLLATNGEQRKVTREQVIFLVGKGDIGNCKGQLHKENVLLRGVGINLNDLPVVDEKTGTMKNTDRLGRIARGASNEQALAQFIIVGKVTRGNKIEEFTIANAGGKLKDIPREHVERLAGDLRIGNARLQRYKGRPILRLIDGRKLEDLPTTRVLPIDGGDSTGNKPKQSNAARTKQGNASTSNKRTRLTI